MTHIVAGSDPVDIQISERKNVALPLTTLWCYIPQRPTEEGVGLVPGRSATLDRPAVDKHCVAMEHHLADA
jgi:hypothetical protein